MKIYGAEKPDVEDVVAHYGVKGMRWGERKAHTPLTASGAKLNRRATATEIHEARGRQRDRAKQLTALNKKHGKEHGKFKYTKEHDDVVQDLLESDDAVISRQKTRGEQIAATILLGPVGLLTSLNTKGRVQSRLSNKAWTK